MEHIYVVKTEIGFQFNDDISKRKRTIEAVEEINRLSRLPCDLLKKYDGQVIERLFERGFTKYIENYMSQDYYGSDGMVSASGYPHDEARFYITEIDLKTNEYDILGIKVGVYFKNIECIFESYGYSKLKEGDKYYFEKDDVQINIIGEELVENIRVEVKTFFLGNKLY